MQYLKEKFVVTGQLTKAALENYQKGWLRIFGKKDK